MRSFPHRVPALLAAGLLLAGVASAGDVYLGIAMDELKPSMSRALGLDEGLGVLINEVIEDSPAAEAGLRSGDVLLRVGDHEITGIGKLTRTLHAYDPGDEVELEVLRDGDRETIDVVLGEREKRGTIVFGDDKGGRSWSWFGPETNEDGETVLRWKDEDGEREMVIGNWLNWNEGRGYLGVVPADLDADELAALGAPDGKGVRLASVLPDGPAHAAGLRDGDVLVSIDGETIDDRTALHEAMQETEAGETVTVRIIRDGDAREVEVELAESPTPMDIGKNLRMYIPGDPHDPKAPRFYERHGGRMPGGFDLEDLEREKEDLAKMREELADLKEELRKLREELQKEK
ncbi:PDZ domain-containing protein [bacterium]|nr:PDZ domain-containing protein [bacterium]